MNKARELMGNMVKAAARKCEENGKLISWHDQRVHGVSIRVRVQVRFTHEGVIVTRRHWYMGYTMSTDARVWKMLDKAYREVEMKK